jgi:5'-nucleotidase
VVDLMRFLLTNDDGIRATGLAALERALDGLGPIHVVAPDRERSGAGHSLTLHQPLRAASVDATHHAVTGTPTDAVLLAIETLLPDRPDFVISGINHGPNMGEDVTYSGTVAAAMEATILGIPAIAVSLAGRDEFQFDALQPLVRRIVETLLQVKLGRNQLLNVNIPNRPPAEIRGVRVTRLGSRQYPDSVVPQTDPRGRPYYWIGGGGPEWAHDERSDANAVAEGYVSVTPLRIDMTDYRAMVELEELIQKWS